jgi:sec-independent protein translocase protein TatB
MGIGPLEIILLLGIALVVIGPEKFPEFMRIVARTVRDLRGYVDDVKRDLTDELRPVQDEMKKLSRFDSEAYVNTAARRDQPEGEEEARSAPAATGNDPEAAVARENDQAKDASASEPSSEPEPPQDAPEGSVPAGGHSPDDDHRDE